MTVSHSYEMKYFVVLILLNILYAYGKIIKVIVQNEKVKQNF